MKKLFVSILPLDDRWEDFHELSIAVLFQNEIKSAYHFKVPIEGGSYSESVLHSQGFRLDEIEKNPQNRWQVYSEVIKILNTYINTHSSSDRATLYTFELEEYLLFNEVMKNSDRYFNIHNFIRGSCSVKDLCLDYLSGSDTLDDYSFTSCNLALLNEGVKRDSFSRLTQLIKIYNLVKHEKINKKTL